jgi:GPI mannosyltransferase 3
LNSFFFAGCRREILALMGLQLLIYSLPAHKEFRFLLPALQLAMPYCGRGAALLATPKGHQEAPQRGVNWRLASAAFCIFLQIPLALYFSTVHQR